MEISSALRLFVCGDSVVVLWPVEHSQTKAEAHLLWSQLCFTYYHWPHGISTVKGKVSWYSLAHAVVYFFNWIGFISDRAIIHNLAATTLFSVLPRRRANEGPWTAESKTRKWGKLRQPLPPLFQQGLFSSVARKSISRTEAADVKYSGKEVSFIAPVCMFIHYSYEVGLTALFSRKYDPT